MTRQEAEEQKARIAANVLEWRGVQIVLGVEERSPDWCLVYEELPCASCGKTVRVYEDFGRRLDAGFCKECRDNPPMRVRRQPNGRPYGRTAEELDEQWEKDA